MITRGLPLLAAALLASASASASASPVSAGSSAPVSGAKAEETVAAAIDQARGNRAVLRVLVQAMPKGGDLHNHLSGAIYAEDYLKLAARDGLCADATLSRLVPPPCGTGLAVSDLAAHQPFAYGKLVNALSTRGWQEGVGADQVPGHDQFFASFERFSPAFGGHLGVWLAAARQEAARNHVLYLELMHDPAAMIAWLREDSSDTGLSQEELPTYLSHVVGLDAMVRQSIAELDKGQADAKAVLDCSGRDAGASPACAVTVRFMAQALRGLPPRQVFRSLIAGFALAHADPRVVGVNIVMPEDDPVALRDYDLHMAMFRLLEARYPDVAVSMHAGELAPGLVPPADLANHITKAVASGARRIGHGTDIALEDDATQTLARMARDHVAVEINLTSNAVILGVRGADHPLHLYRAAGVPLVLSTDDAGVLRSDMTQEYMRAITEQGLGYRDVKTMARASLDYAFLPGASLWKDQQAGVMVASCAASLESPACIRLQQGSEKAALEASLERSFADYESKFTSLFRNIIN